MYRALETSLAHTDMYKTKVVVKSRGEVIWNAPVTWKISCSSDVTWFPVDEQVCEKLTDFVITFTHIRYFTVWFKNLFFESLFILNLYCARTMVNLILLSFFCIMLTLNLGKWLVASHYAWCSGQHYYTTSFNKVWIHFLHRFQSFSPRVRGFLLWESLTMVPAGNKAKRLLSVKHSRNNTLSSSSRSQLITKETIKIESIKHWSRHCDIVS